MLSDRRYKHIDTTLHVLQSSTSMFQANASVLLANTNVIQANASVLQANTEVLRPIQVSHGQCNCHYVLSACKVCQRTGRGKLQNGAYLT